jgi:hypothetical protein
MARRSYDTALSATSVQALDSLICIMLEEKKVRAPFPGPRNAAAATTGSLDRLIFVKPEGSPVRRLAM